MFDKSKRQSRKVLLGILAISAAFFTSSIPLPAQAPAAPQAAAPPNAANASVLVAKIVGSLSTKKAKAGDTLAAKTVQGAKLPDGTEIPKGSKLIAKVTSSTSKKDGAGNSMLSFRFDQVEVKGGAPIPIHGTVIAIGPALPNGVGGLGQGSVLAREGQGSTPGIDPNTGLAKAGGKDEYDIATGSTMEGVALGRHLDADWTTALRGVKTDIDLDSDVVIKVQLK